MAKLSSVNKNEKRKLLVKKYAAKYAKLKAIADDESIDDTERLIARLKLAEIPRNGNPTRIRNRCELTGRPRGVYTKFKLSRIALRELGYTFAQGYRYSRPVPEAQFRKLLVNLP